jgi:hypothetical protein
MAFWTTGEIRTLKKFRTIIPAKDLCAILSRHPHSSIKAMAQKHDVPEYHREKKLTPKNRQKKCLYWLRIAHEHFAKRESEMRG